VVYDLGKEATVCRLAQPMTAGLQAPVQGTEEDPRIFRPLPWLVYGMPLGGVPRLFSPLQLWLTTLGLALALLVVPGVMVWWIVRRRAWLFVPLPLLWLGLALCGGHVLSAMLWTQATSFDIGQLGELVRVWPVTLNLLALALAGLPTGVLFVLVFAWLRRAHWGRLALLLAGTALLAVAAAAAWLHFAPSLEPEQHYSWRGWYSLWPAGLYALGVLLLAGLVLRGAFRGVRWGIRRLAASV
jgi:hypothetical protein